MRGVLGLEDITTLGDGGGVKRCIGRAPSIVVFFSNEKAAVVFDVLEPNRLAATLAVPKPLGVGGCDGGLLKRLAASAASGVDGCEEGI